MNYRGCRNGFDICFETPIALIGGGVFKRKENPQPLYLDLKIKISLKEAADSDDLDDTLDYSLLCQNLQLLPRGSL